MKFITSKDIAVVSALQPRDFFYQDRILNGKMKQMKLKVDFPPRYFGYSGNWAVRCHSRNLNKEIGMDEYDNLTETIYVNENNIHRFYFSAETVSKYNKQRQLDELIAQQPKQQQKLIWSQVNFK